MRTASIIDAASRLFSQRGYRGTSIAAVAREVGMTDAGVLHYFGTKRELLGAVLERSTLEDAGAFREIMALGGISALEGLAGWGAVMESSSEYTGLEITLGAEAIEPGSDLRPFFHSRYRVLRRWLTRAIEAGVTSGEFRSGTNARLEAAALIAFLDGIRLQWYFGVVDSLEVAVREHVEAVIDRISSV